MNVSYEGIGQWAATFACDGVSAGQVVKVSGSGTVAKCADNDGFEGVVLSVARDGKACSVAMGGMLKRHLAPKTLEKLLHNALCPDENQEEDKNIRRILKQKLIKPGKENQDNEA